MIEIPEKLAISGRKGAEKLGRLFRRAEHLRKRIASPGPPRDYDRAELAALEWVIKQIILYENLLKKGPEIEEADQKSL